MKKLLLVVVVALGVWFVAKNWHGIGAGVDAFTETFRSEMEKGKR